MLILRSCAPVSCLDSLTTPYAKLIVVGDFNVPKVNWCRPTDPYAPVDNLIVQWANEHGLQLVATHPTRNNALFDLIFISAHFDGYHVKDLPPVAMSDHDAQLLVISKALCKSTPRQTVKVDYEQLGLILSGVDWLSLFSGCINVDDYAERFTKSLLESIYISSRSKYTTRRVRLPKFIVNMQRKKKKAWKKYKSTGDAVDYIRLRKEVRAAIRQHRRNQEECINSAKNTR